MTSVTLSWNARILSRSETEGKSTHRISLRLEKFGGFDAEASLNGRPPALYRQVVFVLGAGHSRSATPAQMAARAAEEGTSGWVHSCAAMVPWQMKNVFHCLFICFVHAMTWQ